MPLYSFKATTPDNRIEKGSISASNEAEVAEMLKKKGFEPLTISRIEMQVKSNGTLPMVEKITFCHYIATMLNSGLSIAEGMSVLKEETRHPLMRQILDDLLYHLERGQTLSTVFSMYPKAFTDFFITLTKAGELSGTLADTFKYLEEELRAQHTLTSKIKSALVYPIIVICAMIGIGFLMVFFVMPQIGKVFLTMTIPLPAFTKFIFQTSISISVYRIPIILGTIIGAITLFIISKKPLGKQIILKLISPLPVIKNLLKQVDIARFSRIFSTLIASAVPVTDALNIAINSLNYPQYKKAAAPIPEEIAKGRNLAASFSTHKVFPPLLTQMIAAGEKSGTLDQTLKDLALFYEGEVEEAVKKATQMLEPMLMLIVGIGVGAMILSIIAPLYSVVGNLQQGF